MAIDTFTSTPQWSPHSQYAKLMKEWETPVSRGGKKLDPGTPFPAMLYKAGKWEGHNTITAVALPPQHFSTDDQWRRACDHADRFNLNCQRIVKNAEELEQALREGWKPTPQEALAYANGLDDDVARAAAHRAYEDRNMSDGAKAEIVKAEEEAGLEHVAEVPIKRRGRPRKNAPA